MKRLGEFTKHGRWVLVVLLLAVATGLVACGGDDDDSSSSSTGSDTGQSADAGSGGGCKADGPIKIGGVGGITGAIPVAEGTEGAQAYFNELNAKGGVCGQKIEYIIADDKGDPQASATAARKLALQDRVVGMVNESFIDCAVNGKFYEQQGLKVTGVGVNPACYNSPVFAMTNSGPTGSMYGDLFFASSPDGLGKKKVCAQLLRLPGYADQFKNAVAEWEKQSGLKITLYDNTVTPTSDPTTYVVKAKNAGCEAVALVGNVALIPPWMKAVEAQNATDIAWLWPGTNYSPELPKALNGVGDGITYTDPELSADADSPEVKHVYDEVNKLDPVNPANSIHTGGWLGAQIIEAALKTIDGDVTRESLSAALEKVEVPNDFMGGPFKWVGPEGGYPNHWIQVTRINNGKWETVTDGWIDLPGIENL